MFNMDKEKLLEETLKSYEEEFIKINGFPMNRQQKRAIKKKLEVLVNNELKKQI